MRQNFRLAHTKIHKHSFRAMVDAATKKALSGIPLMKTKAGPRDKEVSCLQYFCTSWLPSLNSTTFLFCQVWATRLKEEYMGLIK